MGRAWKFGDNVNTDEIMPARYNITTDEKELAKNVFCEVRPEFAKNVQPGDIIISGKNFGCGSSREHAPIAIKGSGVKCLIAKSYARIFYRNSINIGLPILECEEAYDNINEGDNIDINLEKGIIKKLSTGKEFKAKPIPKFVLKIVDAGGIVNFLKSHEIEELSR
jgi:3-isopropylmalate/(R)-2-methylmalate dehydratase small subunit